MLPPLHAPDFRLDAAYPEVGVLRQAVLGHDWPAVRRLWDAADWAGRSLLTGVVGDLELPGEVDLAVGLLRRVLADDPGDPAAGAMLGCHLVSAGWRVRGAARAKYVGREQFDVFHDHLRRAEQVLIEATARHRDNLAAWEWRLTIARGLSLGQGEALRRWERVVRHDPHHLPAQLSYQQKICPKWGGSWERLHGWSRERMLAAPEGAQNAVLVPLGHLEHWLDLSSDEDARYITSAPVREEIHEAARRSVWHPAFRRTVGWVRTMNVFAAAFGLMGDDRAAIGLFAAVGPLASHTPWDYLGADAGEAFLRYRNKAIARGA